MGKKIENIDECYKKVLALVEQGCNISAAIKTLGIHRFDFYRDLAPEKKRTLKVIKLANGRTSPVTSQDLSVWANIDA